MTHLETAERNAREAHETLAKLQEKESSLAGRLAKTAAERRELAFAANTGDAKAKARLEAVHAQSAALRLQQEDLSAAIAQAAGNTTKADATLADARHREEAEAVLGKLPALRDHLARFDNLLGQFCEVATALQRLYSEVASARASWAATQTFSEEDRDRIQGDTARRSVQSLRNTLDRAIELALLTHGTKLHSEVLPTHLRKSATEAMSPVIDNIERTLRAKIDGVAAPAQRSAALC